MVSHLLIVEDRDEDFLLARRILRHYNPDITLTLHQTGEAALAWLERGNNRLLPELVLLDLNLPRMDGIEFLRKMRNTPRAAKIPVVILTGQARDVSEAYKLGVEGYLLKPITLEGWMETLNKLGIR